MSNAFKILLLVSGILNFFSCKVQTEKELTNPSTEEILKSFDDLMNRPVYKTLTKEILDSIPDIALEQYVFDNIYQQLGSETENELSKVQNLTKGQQAIFSVWWVEAEVNNGGFNQFYFNSSGQYAKMAVDGFQLFGASKFADLMKRANDVYEENRERLEEFDDGSIESFSESYEDNPLNALDQEFYDLYKSEPLNELRIAYIRKHPNEFTQK